MDISHRDTKPLDEIDMLLALAGRFENEGGVQGALDSFQLALDHLAAEDPRRGGLQARISELESAAGPASDPEEPIVVRRKPRTLPERMRAPRPTTPRTTVPKPALDNRNAPIARGGRPDEENQQAASPTWSWLLMGGVVLFGLALPVIVALFLFAIGPPSMPGLARAPGQTASMPSPLAPSAAQRAPAPGAPSTATRAASSEASLPANARQTTIFFDDSFDRSTLDGSKWILDNGSNATIDLSHGTLLFTSSSSHYPYVHSRVNPFPGSGDFRVTVRFQYARAAACGAPIAMANFVLPAGLSHAETDRLSNGAEASGMSIWFWRTAVYYRAGSAREDISVNIPSGWHIATADYVGGAYHLAIDSSTIYTSKQTTARPAVIWMGAPFDLGSGNNCQWDSLDIGNVRVESLR